MSLTPNPQQQAIIDHPSQPLRISAGAGTGKTSTIVRRLAAAVAAGLQPEAALGITFTNKAAEQLADRLREALPHLAADGREVEVSTYHGFAHSILYEYGALVGIERSAKVIGPGYVRQLMLESLTGRTYTALDLTAPGQRVADAAHLAAGLGDNLATAADLRTASPLHQDETWQARLELADIVAAYEETKTRLDVVDYADLVHGAHQLLASHPAVAARIADRYGIVLLDEYQDTAPAQREILRMLFGGGFSITAVGDTDQTIYEWRGASMENFDAFPAHFPVSKDQPAATLPLTTNYRSARLIVDTANGVRAELHGADRFDPLIARPQAPEGRVEARWLRTAEDEASWIASEARRLHDEEDLDWRDIAVLFRKNRQMTLVRDALQENGIPVEVASLGGLLNVPEVADLHAWLSIIEHPEDTPALVRILLGSRYRLGFADLAPLARWKPPSEPLDETERTVDAPWPLLAAVEHLDDIAQLSAEARSRLVEFRDVYRTLVIQAQSVALVELCRRILDEVDAWLELDAMEPVRGLSARLNLYRFLDLAQEWSPLEGRPSLEAFLGYLELLEDEASSDELDTARVGGEDAVTLLTVHRAKGLEWDTVFIPAVVDRNFPSTGGRFDDPTSVAASLPYSLRLDAHTLPPIDGPEKERKEHLRQRNLEGEWRTAYVAVTRAAERLYVSGAFWYGGKTPRKPSRLFEVVGQQEDTQVSVMADEPGEAPFPEEVSDLAGAHPDPLLPEGWAAALRLVEDVDWLEARIGDDHRAYDAAVDQLHLTLDGLPDPPDVAVSRQVPGTSVTGLVTLASCPKRFFWSEVERLPRRPAPEMRRGVEVHRRIELHNMGRIGFEDLDPDAYDVVTPPQRAIAGSNAFDTFLASRFAELRPIFVESPIDIRVGEYRIRGRIDAIYEPEPGLWEIVDYKSGRDTGDPANLVQLQAYALAASDGAIGAGAPDRLKVTFLYLGGGEAVEVSHDVDETWLAAAAGDVASLADQIGSEEFATAPSQACERCDFRSFCEPGQVFVAANSGDA